MAQVQCFSLNLGAKMDAVARQLISSCTLTRKSKSTWDPPWLMETHADEKDSDVYRTMTFIHTCNARTTSDLMSAEIAAAAQPSKS